MAATTDAAWGDGDRDDGHAATAAKPHEHTARLSDAERRNALAALKENHGGYDIAIVTRRDKAGTILLWVAVRLEGKAVPLIGFTPEALDAAIRDDRDWADSR